MIFTSLSKHFEDILAHNHAYVIIKLAEACLKFGTKQEKFIKVNFFVMVMVLLRIKLLRRLSVDAPPTLCPSCQYFGPKDLQTLVICGVPSRRDITLFNTVNSPLRAPPLEQVNYTTCSFPILSLLFYT